MKIQSLNPLSKRIIIHNNSNRISNLKRNKTIKVKKYALNYTKIIKIFRTKDKNMKWCVHSFQFQLDF